LKARTTKVVGGKLKVGTKTFKTFQK
jgi:hypothetical protein